MVRQILGDAPQLRDVAQAPDIEVVAQAQNGRAAVDQALMHRVNVALLDIKMPVMDGLSATEELLRQAPAVRTVMLTSFGDEANVLRALQNGTAGFVAEIGRRLGMSETTIKTYVSRILTKLGCSNRVQAALLVRDARG
ncbi:response regulator transcription factor [Planotetraspora mira]